MTVTISQCRVQRVTVERREHRDDHDFDVWRIQVFTDESPYEAIEVSLHCAPGADIGLDALLPIPGCDGVDMMDVTEMGVSR